MTVALSATATAVAAGGGGPKLGAPNGKHVNPGHIKLVVTDPSVPPGNSVFVAIQPKRKLDKSGYLTSSCKVQHRCSFLQLKKWKHHPGKWIYNGPWFQFPGSWSFTAGKLYWQADHVPSTCTGHPGCQVVSKIGSFVVK
jgi:hypothetical protein